MIQYLIVLIILKVLHPRIREHTADPVDGAAPPRRPRAWRSGQNRNGGRSLSHSQDRSRDPESKDQPRQRRMGRSLRRLNKILIGFLPESLHRHDGIAVTVRWKISSNSWMNPAAINFSSVISESPSIFSASLLTNRSKLLIFSPDTPDLCSRGTSHHSHCGSPSPRRRPDRSSGCHGRRFLSGCPRSVG